MEASVSNQKTIERVVSHRALQMGSSFSCQICVVGFLCGVCIASLFVAALTSFGSFGLGGVSMSSISMGISQLNTSSNIINIFTSSEANIKLKETRMKKNDSEKEEENRASLLYSAWSMMLKEPSKADDELLLHTLGLTRSMVPEAPHLEDCKSRSRLNSRLDNRENEEKFPPWSSWKGALDTHPASLTNDQFNNFRRQQKSQGTYPPWVMGSDEENYPMTRRVQRDVWIHQHPLNCSRDSSLRFLVADWERLAGFGMGAQFAGMCGLLAIALKEKRILVTNYYNRADHHGCKGKSRGSWSCYFLRETSEECRERAIELTTSEEAWAKGIITSNNNYTSKQIWAGRIPRLWGEPWNYLQPTTEINGSLIASHRKMDRRWWRAQALRYLMRFQTEYTCGLMNAARHASFGMEAAKNVVATLGTKWPKEGVHKMVKSEIEEFVWSNHRPWIPRPLLSIHVRMGDKACEMKVVEFEEYMRLAARIRTRFPHLNRIWISTEMQQVIDNTKQYKPQWEFYYTRGVKRQVGNITMASYETSLGRETSTNYPLVNFLMASDADFFIGALGSTWCFLIDGMRNTAGKVMAGYLSVNKDRFW